MEQRLSEIVVLRPTPVFLSFLASQLPDQDIPDFTSLKTDNTAYVIAKKNNDGTLNEIERYYPTMFRHEISRWLGETARNPIEKNFLDFLCCFKFELHSHLILMEPSLLDGQQMLQIKPRMKLLNWLRSVAQGHEELVAVMEQVNLSHLVENATVLVKNFHKLTEIKPFIQQYYKPIFTTAMSRMSNKSWQWPDMHSYQDFNQYFSVEIHTQLIHLHF